MNNFFKFALLTLLCGGVRCDDDIDGSKKEGKSAESVTPKKSRAKEIVTSTGKKFWFLPDPSTDLVQIIICFKNVGAAHQKKTKEGLPELFSHSIFCGSGKYSKNQFADQCLKIAAQISCSAGIDHLYFSLTVPKMTLSKGLALFKVLLTSPNFEEDKVKMTQLNLAYSLQNYAANPIGVAMSSILPAMLFELHPYGKGVAGSSEDCLMLSVIDLFDYHKSSLTLANAEICAGGGLSSAEAVSALDQILSGIPGGKATKSSVVDVKPRLPNVIKRYYAEGPQSTIFFAQQFEKPNSSKRFSAMMLSKILGEGGVFKGRILSELRTKAGLIYGGSVYFVDWQHCSWMVGILQTDNANVDKAIAQLKKIIGNLRKNGITKEELNFAKENVMGRLLVDLRTSQNLCFFFLKRKLEGSGLEVFADFSAGVNSVTLPDVNDLVAIMLNEEAPFIVIGGGEGGNEK
ncbi:MAG: insulinase family protein [Holosporaceae bacterium]|nr:insulinase family protein [Holosporaceae bacterium]